MSLAGNCDTADALRLHSQSAKLGFQSIVWCRVCMCTDDADYV